jgi:excisionase family DNA binding protein
VSLLLRIPLATVYHLSKQKKIRGVKIGKHWRYLASDIFRFFETREEIQNGVSV